MPELTQLATDLPRSAAPVGPAEYQRVIARVRDEVARVVPPGSVVLVVSRGDEELIRFPNHKGWHFPRTAGGEYVGYHPEDGRAAIAQLEELRSAGAAFLVFPRTAFWWFEYYGELVEYLQENARRVVDDHEVCLIFAFEGAFTSAAYVLPAQAAMVATPVGASDRLGDLVAALLPEDCSVAIAVGEYEKLPTLEERGIWRLALPDPVFALDAATGADLVEQLEALAAIGIAYLVLPRHADDLVRLNPTLEHHLETKCRIVTRQRYVGTIYALKEVPPIQENGDRRRGGRKVLWP